MLKKEAQYKIKGISQDLATQLFSSDYAYEMRNIRVNATDENSLGGLTNEKGNKKLDFTSNSPQIYDEITGTLTTGGIEGDIIGVGTFSDCAVIFTTTSEGDDYYESGQDNIYLFYKSKDENNQDIWAIKNIYSGNLGFDKDHLLQTLCVYENEDLQKVYWIDGKNIPRVINIAPDWLEDDNKHKKVENQHIDFLPKLSFGETVTIEKTSGGTFSAGVIQYVITYSDRNMQESNIWYASPLYYISPATSGAKADESCNVAFKLSFSNLSVDFDFMQIYAIVRTSLNAAPSFYRIANIPTSVTSFLDTGHTWETVTAQDILTKQLSTFIPQTIASKDNTLFLGNYELNSEYIDSTDKDISAFVTAIAEDTNYEYIAPSEEGESKTVPQSSREIATFRTGEYYRVGLQFQDESGAPSGVIFLKDMPLPNAGDAESGVFTQKVIKSIISSVPNKLNPFKRVRLMMVDRTSLPHRSICQGILCPTLYRLKDRMNNNPFAISSWNMRGISDYWLGSVAQEGEQILADPVWDSNTALYSNKRLYRGEIENQIDDDTAYEDTDSVNYGHIKLDSKIILSGNSGGSGSLYYYLLLVNGHCEVYPDYYYYRLVVYLGRTLDASVTKFKDCSEKYIKGLSFYEAISKSTSLEDANIALKNKVFNIVSSVLEGKAGITEVQAQEIAGTFTSDPLWHPLLTYDINYQHCFVGSRGLPSKTSKYSGTIDFDNVISYAQTLGQDFYCDHNILTFHSPDIEANQVIIDDNPNIKYRVIGYTVIKETFFDNYIKVLTQTHDTSDTSNGLQIINKNSLYGLYNVPLWKDDNELYPVYTWHHTLSLGKYENQDSSGKWYGSYENKIFANVHFCEDSFVFSNGNKVKNYEPKKVIDIDPTTRDSGCNFPLMGTPRVFNSDEVTALSLDSQEDSTCRYPKLIYYGNVSIAHAVGSYKVPKIIVEDEEMEIIDSDTNISDSCIIQYKSTPHVVIPMQFFTTPENQEYKKFAPTLPRLWNNAPSYIEGGIINDNVLEKVDAAYYWSTSAHGIALPAPAGGEDWEHEVNYWPSTDNGMLYIAELYQNLNADDIYGNSDEESLSKLSWIPISDWVTLKSGATLTGYGDTFLGRWDCLKTYAYSTEGTQSYTDVTSLIIESDINLSSRYDKFKDVHNATVVNPTNFNLFNPVYNQLNNLFSYSTLRRSDSINKFVNQICWSNVKVNGEEIDNWCQINVGNNLDLQGAYGELRKMLNFKNNLYCFQDNAIYKINYNSRVMVAASDGAPIEISSNNRVEPPLLLSKDYGITSRFNAAVSRRAVYFYDSTSNKIGVLGADDNITELSSIKGMNSLLKLHKDISRVNYDITCDDIYFNSDDMSLAFNEEMEEFTSLYEYYQSPFIFELQGHSFATKESYIYEQRANPDYCNFYDTQSGFYVELLSNPDALIDKTFTNIEFSMVATDHSGNDIHSSFDSIKAEDSYQESNETSLPSIENDTERGKVINPGPLPMKRKFRYWRLNIPRAIGSIDRIRDFWAKFTLKKNSNGARYKHRINNFNVQYVV